MPGKPLVLVTFLAGASWGLLANLQLTVSPAACKSLSVGVTEASHKSAITNINTPPAIEREGSDVVVVGSAGRVGDLPSTHQSVLVFGLMLAPAARIRRLTRDDCS